MTKVKKPTMNKKDKLTTVEIEHIFSLIEDNESNEWYFGNKEQYWKRTERIKKKLNLYHQNNKTNAR